MKNLYLESYLMEKKQDARVRYTKMMIRSSFIELLREKPVAKVSVTELCERAGINRATFYAHYADPSDLLRSIEEEFMSELSRWVGPAISARSSGALEETLTAIIEYIGENAAVCSVLLSSSGDANFQAKVVDAVEQPFLSSFSYDGSREEAKYYYTFAADGSVGMIKKWLAGGMKIPPKTLAGMIARFTARAG